MGQGKLKTTLSEFNPVNIYHYLNGLRENFGWPFFLMMTSTYVGIKGALHYFGAFVELPYYRTIKLEGVTYQVNSAASFSPWTAKGYIGVLSDVLPLFGYQKTTYLLFYTVFGCIGMLLLAGLSLEFTQKYNYIVALLFFLIFLQTAGYDLLLEGKYVEQMKKRPKTQGNIVTYSWFGTLVGQFIPAILVGTLSDHIDVRYLFLIFFPFAVQPLIFISLGGMVDDFVPKEISGKLNTEKLRKQWKPIFLTLLMGTGGLGLAVVALFTSRIIQLIYSITISVIVIILSLMLLNPIIAKANAYKFFGQTFYINIMGAMDYYYLADDECVEGGPGFSYTFYKTYAELIGAFAQILGLIIFQVVFTKWKFRFIYWFSTFLRMAGSVFDIIIVMRWNIAIGIPDGALFIFGNAVIYKLTYMIDFIPGMILNAKLSPKHVEATMFSLLASSSNYGQSISKIFGAYLIEAFGVTTTIEQGCHFENLVYVIIVAHLLAPIVALLLAFVLIPNLYIKDTFVDDKDTIAEYEQISKELDKKLEMNKQKTAQATA